MRTLGESSPDSTLLKAVHGPKGFYFSLEYMDFKYFVKYFLHNFVEKFSYI